ncbi:hypothetical protein CMV_015564 [Castanea mollissima]|uniref:Leucine-rich repeat-containing N-terminal plant-type domain-containing protein n=1 Tax=Castanea mollissima TaxID=60419 RepID=A0A8J4R9E2_9ROSI|nr:hypothetical protein CMV_015564 [Castanea mollissima]
MFTHFLALLSLYYLIFASFPFVQPLCHDDESFALLQFKESFIIDQFASSDPSAYSKVSSWKRESDDCCSWDGVECDKNTGFDHVPVILPWTNLRILELSHNKLQGISVPIPPSSIATYEISNNILTGEIPLMICNLSLFFRLDLSYNNLRGMLPDCLGNFSGSLSILNL